MKIRIPVTAIILAVFFAAPVFAEVDLEKIVVRPASFYSFGRRLRHSYDVDSVSSKELTRGDTGAATSPLEHVSGVDLRSRGPEGTQADPSIRGSTYEEVAVLLDGVKIMDPQTGHYNLDIPVTRFDLERADVMKEPSSALYGPGACAGAINLVTKRPEKNQVQAEYLFGEHALQGQGASVSRAHDDLYYRVSYEHTSAKAATPDTDFEHKTGTVYVNKDMGLLSVDNLTGYQKKDYGAGSFYSNLFPAEEEHTQTFFTRTGMRYSLDPGSIEEQVYFRRHRDKFILDRNNPVSVNYHTTYVYGANSQLRIPTKLAEFTAGLDTSNEEINSSNLGKHKRPGQAFYFGVTPDLGERASADMRVRTDYYQDWGWNQSYNLGSGYWLIPDAFKMRASFAHALRIPTFTELFYRDAANLGNSSLDTEESDGVTAGLLYQRGSFSSYADGFLRKARNVIDWTRFNASSPWQATNLGKIDFKGVECGLNIDGIFSSSLVSFDRLKASYSHTEADSQATGFLSKYALDVLTHQVLMELEAQVFALEVSGSFSYNQRRFGESYFLGSVTVSKKIAGRGFMAEPFVTVDNIADTHYSEVGGVVQPGRWVKSGMRLSW